MKILCFGGLQGMDALRSAIYADRYTMIDGDELIGKAVKLDDFSREYDWIICKLSRSSPSQDQADFMSALTLCSSMLNLKCMRKPALSNQSQVICDENADFTVFQFIAPVTKTKL